jgi:branched-chain amino acid transport system ATP-binding protein
MLLRLEDVTRRFGGLVAVDHLSFDVFEGEILGVIGPNGAGKTTAINVISALYPATSGKVIFAGQDLTGLKPYDIAKRGIARTFQSSVLFMELPVIDNVYMSLHLSYQSALWARFLRLPSAVAEERALKTRAIEILERMGLGHVSQELTRNLPHGQQRTLGVCMALATNPRLLLLDEPLTGMNATEIHDMVGRVRGIRDDGTTIVMIEHNMSAVMSLCERLVVMDHGQNIAEGPPAQIQRDQAVIEAYLGAEVVPASGGKG